MKFILPTEVFSWQYLVAPFFGATECRLRGLIGCEPGGSRLLGKNEKGRTHRFAHFALLTSSKLAPAVGAIWTPSFLF